MTRHTIPEFKKYYGCTLICGFPGVGKSTYAEERSAMDLNSRYALSETDSNFPANCIKRIKQLGKAVSSVVFLSNHKSVRDALVSEGIPHNVVYPNPEINKEVYIKNYKDRGDAEAFIELAAKNWDGWLQDIRGYIHKHEEIVNGYQLGYNDYIGSVFSQLETQEKLYWIDKQKEMNTIFLNIEKGIEESHRKRDRLEQMAVYALIPVLVFAVYLVGLVVT